MSRAPRRARSDADRGARGAGGRRALPPAGVVALLAVVAWGAPRAALADDFTDAQDALDRGIVLFDRGELRPARAEFSRAARLAPGKANPWRWLGLVDVRLGHCQKAVEELSQFLSRVPADDPRAVDAAVLRDRCHGAGAARGAGALVVETTPGGAEVRLDRADGSPSGMTPYRNDALLAGAHVVYLTLAGYAPASRSVVVTENQTLRLQQILLPAPFEPDPAWRGRRWIWPVVGASAAFVLAAVAVGLSFALSTDYVAAERDSCRGCYIFDGNARRP